jgi:hypothetical protein
MGWYLLTGEMGWYLLTGEMGWPAAQHQPWVTGLREAGLLAGR